MTITSFQEALPMPAKERAMLPLIDIPEGLKLVLAAIPKGVQLPTHATTYPASVQLLQGSIEVMRGETWIQVAPGGRVAFEPGQLHAIKALESSYILVTHLRHLAH
ncbi:MAG TPA: hypothetical protein PKM35_04275 [Holophaga sp.]|nr:hypothetical protein [Holophaga sp.]HPS67184.1 hypothetical protein [Holophaga sp.]